MPAAVARLRAAGERQAREGAQAGGGDGGSGRGQHPVASQVAVQLLQDPPQQLQMGPASHVQQGAATLPSDAHYAEMVCNKQHSTRTDQLQTCPIWVHYSRKAG